MTKRAQATKRTRDCIERALIRALAEKSFGELTMLEIAGMADVSVRTVQRHYASKDDLLAATIRYPEQAISEELAKRGPQDSPRGAMTAFVTGMFMVFQVHRVELWPAYVRAADVPQVREILLAGVERREDAVDALVEAWPEAWAVDPSVARQSISRLTSYPAWRAFTDYDRFTTGRAAEFVSDLLCRALLRDYPQV